MLYVCRVLLTLKISLTEKHAYIYILGAIANEKLSFIIKIKEAISGPFITFLILSLLNYAKAI